MNAVWSWSSPRSPRHTRPCRNFSGLGSYSMETRRIERAGKDTLCVRYAGDIWVCPKKDTGFDLGERPYVFESGSGVMLKRINGRLKEVWHRLERPRGILGVVEMIAQRASRLDGVSYTIEQVEIVKRPCTSIGFAWTREARIGKHSTGPRLTADDQQVLNALDALLHKALA